MALSYLHSNGIRHKDIKPANILLLKDKNGKDTVSLCDFATAFRYGAREGGTTEGPVKRWTRRYAAPEVHAHEKRNTSSDVWSLGCVFLEMLSIIKESSIAAMRNFLSSSVSSDRSGLDVCYSTYVHRIPEWLHRLGLPANSSGPQQWTLDMVSRRERLEVG